MQKAYLKDNGAILTRITDTYGQATAKGAIELLLKLFKNIQNHPAEIKFRKIKSTNATLKAKLFALTGMETFLTNLGFVFDGSDFYVFSAQDISPISNSIIVFEARMMSLNAPDPTGDPELSRKNREAQAEAQLKERWIKKEIAEKAAHDKTEKDIDRQLNPCKDSLDIKPVFGANITKFEAPRGGGG